MIDAERAIRKSVECRCGKVHSTGVTKVVFEKNVFEKAAGMVSEVLAIGHILFVSTNDTGAYLDIRHSLRRADFKVSEMIYDAFVKASEKSAGMLIDILDRNESIRLIVGAGSGTVNDIVKYASSVKKIPNMFFITAPSTDSWLNSKVYLDDSDKMKEFDGTPPVHLIADIGNKCPKALVAAGFATLYSRLISIFDYEYQCRVTGTAYCGFIIDGLKKDIRDFLAAPFNPSDSDDLRRLMICLVNVSLKLSYISDNPPIKAADLLTRLIRLHNHNCPSAPLIAALSLHKVYSSWLAGKPADILIPPDRSCYYELMNKYFGIDETAYLLNVIEYDNIMPKIAYTTNQIRKELMAELKSIMTDSEEISGNIRRIFIDKGYHISKVLDFKDLMKFISITGELSEGFPLIKYIEKTGVLSHYL